MSIKFPTEYISGAEDDDRTSPGLSQIPGVEKYDSIDGNVTNVTNLNASNITTGTLSADRIGADSITASKLASDYIVVGNAADDVNSNSVEIEPGKILISGSTRLDDWSSTSDATFIDGGEIYTGSITTNELSATAIDGMTITGATIKTSNTNSRVELSTSDQIEIYSGGSVSMTIQSGAEAGLINTNHGFISFNPSEIAFSGNKVSTLSGLVAGTIYGDMKMDTGDINMDGHSVKNADQIILQKKSSGYSSDHGSIYYYEDGGNQYFGSNNDGWDGRFSQVAQ